MPVVDWWCFMTGLLTTVAESTCPMPFWPSQFFWCSHSSPSCSSVSIYPCGWFQRLLNKYHLQRQALNTFIDAFQGSFNDVTNGTRDCRCFAALFLIIRVVTYLLLGLPLIVLSYSLLVDALGCNAVTLQSLQEPALHQVRYGFPSSPRCVHIISLEYP